MAKWIEFILSYKGEKTSVWFVSNAETKEKIGYVKWYGPWRKYCYFPIDQTVYEQDCLRDIANFIENATKEHRQKVKQ